MYLLDTNVLSELMRRQPNPKVEARFESEPAPLFTSSICVEEIRYGAGIAPPGNLFWERFERDVLPHISVLGFDLALAQIAGDLRAHCKINGTPPWLC